jgi:hypothetical protein
VGDGIRLIRLGCGARAVGAAMRSTEMGQVCA